LFRIKFYKDKQGNEPIKDYLKDLRQKSQTSKSERIKLKKISEYIEILKTYGTRAGKPYVEFINDDLWELRPTDDRIFFFYWKDNTFVLLHHFIKKTNKTPEREKEQARHNLKDFLERGQFVNE